MGTGVASTAEKITMLGEDDFSVDSFCCVLTLLKISLYFANVVRVAHA